jgi:drug/metabolite transporter (DMT)-like permease
MPVDEHTRRQRLAVFLGLLGVIVFGLTMPATRAAVLELDPLFITLGRALLAALLAAVTLVIARPQPPLRRDWGRLFWFAVCSIIGFPLLMTTAMQYAPASHAAVVLAVLPLLTAMAGVLVARERPSPAFWACGIAGTVVVLVYALLSGGGSGDLHWADLLLAAAALSAATAYALGGEMSHRIGGWEVISWALVVSAPVMLLLFLILSPPINWEASASAWTGFLYVAVFSQFLGFFAWNKGMSLGGIAKIGQMQLLQPFVTLVGAYLLLGESIGWMELFFSVVVVGLVALGWRMRVTRSP